MGNLEEKRGKQDKSPGLVTCILNKVLTYRAGNVLNHCRSCRIWGNMVCGQSVTCPTCPDLYLRRTWDLQVIDYRTQQSRLFPLLATAYAFRAVGFWMQLLYADVMKRLKNDDFTTLPEVHACTAGLKSVTTAITSVFHLPLRLQNILSSVLAAEVRRFLIIWACEMLYRTE